MGSVSIDEANNLIMIQYAEGATWDQVVSHLVQAFEEITAPYRYDWLLDFRGLTGKPRVLQLERVGQRWHSIAKGRDVGRRTAVVSEILPSTGFARHSECIWPFRMIRSFDDFETARAWIWSVCPSENSEFQLI